MKILDIIYTPKTVGAFWKNLRIINYYFKNVLQNGIALIEQTIKYGVEQGEFRKESLDIDPVILVGANVYTTVWNILFDDLSPIQTDKVAQDLVDVFLKGLEKN